MFFGVCKRMLSFRRAPVKLRGGEEEDEEASTPLMLRAVGSRGCSVARPDLKTCVAKGLE